MKKLFALLLVLSSCFALNLSLDQPSLHVETDRGATTRHRINLTNRSETELRLKVYVMDWKYAPNGAKEFLRPGASSYSCAGWITLSAETVAIPPLSAQEYRFELHTPDNARGGHQAVIFFETEGAETAAGGVQYGARLGALIYQKTRKNTLDAIEPVSLKSWRQDNVYMYDLSIQNKGDAWNSVQGYLTLLEDGEVLEQVELGPKGILPGGLVSYAGNFQQGAAAQRVEMLYMFEDFGGAVQTGQLLSLDSAEAIAQTKLWVERFDARYNPTQNVLQIYCAVEASNALRINPVVKIYNSATKQQVKTVEFNPKSLQPYKTEIMRISWPAQGVLTPGEYNCVLNIKNGAETVSAEKTIRIQR